MGFKAQYVVVYAEKQPVVYSRWLFSDYSHGQDQKNQVRYVGFI